MPHIPQVICGTCELEMAIEQSGTTLESNLDDGSPYYKIQADTYKCVTCGTIAHLPARAVRIEHFELNYADIRADAYFSFL